MVVWPKNYRKFFEKKENGEQENKDVIRVKSSKFTVTAKEEIPWVLDGEFGG